VLLLAAVDDRSTRRGAHLSAGERASAIDSNAAAERAAEEAKLGRMQRESVAHSWHTARIFPKGIMSDERPKRIIQQTEKGMKAGLALGRDVPVAPPARRERVPLAEIAVAAKVPVATKAKAVSKKQKAVVVAAPKSTKTKEVVLSKDDETDKTAMIPTAKTNQPVHADTSAVEKEVKLLRLKVAQLERELALAKAEAAAAKQLVIAEGAASAKAAAAREGTLRAQAVALAASIVKAREDARERVEAAEEFIEADPMRNVVANEDEDAKVVMLMLWMTDWASCLAGLSTIQLRIFHPVIATDDHFCGHTQAPARPVLALRHAAPRARGGCRRSAGGGSGAQRERLFGRIQPLRPRRGDP